MRNKKTIVVVPGIVLMALLIFAVTRSCGGVLLQCKLFFTHRVYASFFGEALIGLALAAVVAIVCWLVLVWDAGDKIPPLVMALTGAVVIALFLVDRLSPIHVSFFFSRIFYASFALTIGALFLVIGAIGLFGKPGPK
ncbi:MAG: hypothetical protein JW748_01335 [Anaerolineales bacterium]|nr:hypothetical protein [Anaerolineales bacterium]